MRQIRALGRAYGALVGSLLVGGLVLSGSLAAQDPVETNPAGPDPAGAGDPGPLAVVLEDEVQLLCWPTQNSPSYEDVLAKGVVLRIGESRDGFQQVLLPLGPFGYVHKRFASEPADGKVQPKGRAVAFRRRPQSGEAPVTSLAEGSELWVVGEVGDWWCVRFPAREAWVPAAAVELVVDRTPELLSAQEAFAAAQQAQVESYLAEVADRRAQQLLADEQERQLQELQTKLSGVLGAGATEAALAELATATDALLATLAEEGQLQRAAGDLKRRIAQEKWNVEAEAVLDEQPVPPSDLTPLPPPVVRDPLDRFQAVGFLRYQRSLVGPGRFVIEKGRQPLYVVTCDSGRYNLNVFVGREVGLIGSRRRPSAESLRQLDVERLEVLSGDR